jgi:uncharacterized protein (TIGR02597 family)
MSPRSLKAFLMGGSIALAITAFPSATFGQANTPPLGVIVYTLPTGSSTPVGVPLFAEAVFTGAATAVTPNSVTSSAATWTPGQFAQPGSPYFALILSGGQTGRLLRVTGNTATTLTLDVGSTGLGGDPSNPAFAVAAGDRFELFPGETISSLFGDGSVNNPVQLQKGTFSFNADSVQIFNGVKWVSYYFNSTNNFWTNASGAVSNQNNLVLQPDAGLLIGRRGSTIALTISGRVPTTNLVTRIAGGSASSVPVRFPKDTTLGALNFSNPGTWVASDDPLTADRVNLFNGVKWVAYWKTVTGSIWRQLDGDGSDQGGKVIPAGSAMLIQKQGAAGDSASFFTQAIPYTP